MLKKALTYCLQDDDPINISQLIGVKEFQKQPKIPLENFITTSQLKQMIKDQRNDNRAQSQDYISRKQIPQIKQLNQTKVTINRKSNFRIPIQELTGRKSLHVRINNIQINQKLFFDKKQKVFKTKVQLQPFHLEDMF